MSEELKLNDNGTAEADPSPSTPSPSSLEELAKQVQLLQQEVEKLQSYHSPSNDEETQVVKKIIIEAIMNSPLNVPFVPDSLEEEFYNSVVDILIVSLKKFYEYMEEKLHEKKL